MRVIALLLALALFVLGVLYGMGKVAWFTESGAAQPHIKHMIVLWVLAFLCLIWARFQAAPKR